MTAAKQPKPAEPHKARNGPAPSAPTRLSKSLCCGTEPVEGRPLGVYVHFPWCLQKCPYCDFLSIASPRKSIPHAAYADAVIGELERRARDLGPRPLRSVFFGGGTPSLWEPRDLGRVLDAIVRAFPSSDAEVTAECNPSSFDAARARELLAAGVNRVSIGVQSLDAERLAFLGRLHDAPGALAAVRTALDAGVPRVSADLIFGVTRQSPEDAVAEALSIAELGLTHLSVYALTIEPGTEFGARARKGRLPLAREDDVAESFGALDAALDAAGFDHYEISNFARADHVARHNLGYWHGDDYLGLGTGAWGTLSTASGRVRYRNTPSPDRYLATRWSDAPLDRAGSGLAQSELEPIPPETALCERILLGLRLAVGLNVAEAARQIGAEAWPRRRARAAERLLERGRLARDGDRVWIPKSQWLLADGTIAELL
jgi:putative oxygen-independent coproporphyrinogen III oxidase